VLQLEATHAARSASSPRRMFSPSTCTGRTCASGRSRPRETSRWRACSSRKPWVCR
jgi:hypothetical protein